MHFHAKWRTADMKTRPFHDWTYCDLKGKGVFVGDMLSIMSPVGAWWGEGDEKIFVDGETFPSWFGTGSEDYYGYAWSNPEPFQHPYHNQTRCDGKGTGATFGLTSVNRFHILDAIPFDKSFRFDMECWHWDPNVTVNYAATSYWYARPGATDDFEPVDAEGAAKLSGRAAPAAAVQDQGGAGGRVAEGPGQEQRFSARAAGFAAVSATANGAAERSCGAGRSRPASSSIWSCPCRRRQVSGRGLPDQGARLRRRAVPLDGKPLGKPIDCSRAGESAGDGGDRPRHGGTEERPGGAARWK